MHRTSGFLVLRFFSHYCIWDKMNMDHLKEITKRAHEIKREALFESKWIGLKKITYKDPTGQERTWESAERMTRKGECDAVVIAAFVRSTKLPTKLVLTCQYRPSVGKYCVEFPAGLIDEGEDPGKSAVRELKEETGYDGIVLEKTSIVYNDPGFTNTNMRIIMMEIDADKLHNKHPKPQPEEGEFIEIFLAPIDNLLETLNEYEKKGHVIDARLMSLAYGMKIAHQLGK